MRIKKLLSKINLSALAFLAYSVRLIAFGASTAEAIIVFALAGLYGFQLYLKSIEPEPLNDQIKKEVNEIKGIINALRMEKSVRNEKTKRYF